MAADIRVHLYALCWNEARLLPFFFDHYDPVVDRYFIFDNGSTDGSLDLLRNHSKVTLGEFEVQGPSFVQAAQEFYNHCWKPSRGQADWVIICNIDEHLYHPDLRRYLASLLPRISLVIPEGFDMISEAFPSLDRSLREQVPMGRRDPLLDKPQLFRPDRIRETNFEPGRHTADTSWRVRWLRTSEVKLLHYKFLGLDYYVSRLGELRQGLGRYDIARGWGFQYLWDEQRKREEFHKVQKEAILIP
jgi:hypothetical protein